MPDELILILVFLLGLSMYVFLGGADFGLGIWSLLLKHRPVTEGRSEPGPGLYGGQPCLAGVLPGASFGAFPAGLAGLCQALWLPLLCALLAILFRGAAFALWQSYDGRPGPRPAGNGFRAEFRVGALLLRRRRRRLGLGGLQFTPQGQFVASSPTRLSRPGPDRRRFRLCPGRLLGPCSCFRNPGAGRTRCKRSCGENGR